MKYYETTDNFTENQEEETLIEYGCGYCWDKRANRSKELFFLDKANNLRVCLFCPNCGRQY